MADKVNLQEALDRLVSCPVCGNRLMTYPEYPSERTCACGDFVITAVWLNGDVEFTFKMNGPETEERIADEPEPPE